MALRRISLEAINDSRLGRTQRNPIARDVLEQDKETPNPFHRFFVEIVSSFEFALEGEFADEKLVLAALTPERCIRLGSDSFAEIEHADILQHFFDDRVVDQVDSLG